MGEPTTIIDGIATSFIPRDHENEKSRSVKICTRSSHVVIILFLLILFFFYIISKNITETDTLNTLLYKLIKKRNNDTEE